MERNSHQAERLELFMGSILNGAAYSFCGFKKTIQRFSPLGKILRIYLLNFPLSGHSFMYEKLQNASNEAHNTEIKYNFEIPVNKAKVTYFNTRLQ
jgi:hypothetical protein